MIFCLFDAELILAHSEVNFIPSVLIETSKANYCWLFLFLKAVIILSSSWLWESRTWAAFPGMSAHTGGG